jgi:hypothetical protein
MRVTTLDRLRVLGLDDIEEALHRSRWESEVVVRRIARPLSELCLDELRDTDSVRFLGGLMASREGAAVILHVPAVVRLGSLASTTVEVQVVEWSTRRSELRIVPTSTYVGLWTEHRRRRYFDAVHDVADRLVVALDCVPQAA